jgi:hypothetical protein
LIGHAAQGKRRRLPMILLMDIPWRNPRLFRGIP